MNSQYDLIKKIMNNDEEITKNYNRIKFRDLSIEKSYEKFSLKFFKNILHVPSIVIFLLHIFKTINIFTLQGFQEFFFVSVLFMIIDTIFFFNFYDFLFKQK